MLISIVCIKNNEKLYNEFLNNLDFQRNVNYELITIENEKNKFTSAGTAYNSISNQINGEYIIFICQEVRFIDELSLHNIIDSVEKIGEFGVAGIVGVKNEPLNKPEIISTIIQGKDKRKVGNKDIKTPEEVQIVDECFLIIKRENYFRHMFSDKDGWYLYSVEYCLDSIRQGNKNYVIPAKVWRISDGIQLNYKYIKQVIEMNRKGKDKFDIECVIDKKYKLDHPETYLYYYLVKEFVRERIKDGNYILFSILVPVYNVEQYICECLDSIIFQIEDFEFNTELILIDDGSTDSSGSICDKYALNYSFIRVYHNENHGLLYTRRFGFQHANGEYIINCDSDDKLDIEYLKKITSMIILYDYDVALFNAYTYSEGKKEARYKDVFSDKNICLINRNIVLNDFFAECPITNSMWGKVYKKSCLNDIDYKKIEYINQGEDTIQSAEIYTNAKKIIYINDFLYYYRISSGMTMKYDKEFYHNWKKILLLLREYKEKWDLQNFDKLYAIKYFNCVGRAITQSTYSKLAFAERKSFLKDIREDSLYKEMHFMKDKITCNLKKEICSIVTFSGLQMLFDNSYNMYNKNKDTFKIFIKF